MPRQFNEATSLRRSAHLGDSLGSTEQDPSKPNHAQEDRDRLHSILKSRCSSRSEFDLPCETITQAERHKWDVTLSSFVMPNSFQCSCFKRFISLDPRTDFHVYVLAWISLVRINVWSMCVTTVSKRTDLFEVVVWTWITNLFLTLFFGPWSFFRVLQLVRRKYFLMENPVALFVLPVRHVDNQQQMARLIWMQAGNKSVIF